MIRKIFFQIAGIALFGVITAGFILSDEIGDIWRRYSLKQELAKLNALSKARGRARTQAEIDKELGALVSKLERGNTEQNTDALIKIMGFKPEINSLRLAIDLTHHKDFVQHTHPREELLEYVAETVKHNKELEIEIGDGNRQVGIDTLAEFIRFVRSRH